MLVRKSLDDYMADGEGMRVWQVIFIAPFYDFFIHHCHLTMLCFLQ